MEYKTRSIIMVVVVFSIMVGIAFFMNNMSGGFTTGAVYENCGSECASNSDCDDSNACTIEECVYNDACGANCKTTVIEECKDDDGCCPIGCKGKDKDC